VIISKTADSAASGIDARSDDGLSARLDKDAVSQLRAYLDGKVTVMLGHSGVGKSTMVNALTGAERATGGVNAVTGRGRHTSSSALALKLADAPAGSWIIDTPGIRSFGLAHVDPDRILHSFPDLEPGTEACERGCKHDAAAVNCGVDAWVAAGHAGPTGAARLASLRRLLGTDPRAEGQETKELGSVG
jgi:ribosome biogenesis GTPase